MQKQNTAQLEMFTLDGQDAAHGRGVSAVDPIRLKKVRDYQKMIFRGSAIMLICLVSFSLGVEKGKRTAVVGIAPLLEQPRLEETADIAVPPQTPPAITHTPADIRALASGRPGVQEAALKQKQKKASYTIQVASISEPKNARRQLASLENKGYSAFSLVKGKYTVICVGRFSDKEDARNNLEKLKVKYPDCLIRRL